MAKVKALRLQVNSNPSDRKCANGGWTQEHDELFVICGQGNWDVETDDPALFKLTHSTYQVICLVPYNGGEGAGPMMGGSYAGTCDSRFTRMCESMTGHPWHGAVAVHDRYESWELYEALSR